ncbi:MAG: DNA polymerase IV [Clostridia bacterium]|nr:DNA polymerase IV [Clostridia bacterium]
MERKIIHLDMDAFYAAIEERDNPELRGKPVVVGALPNERGVVSTCNYEARKYGIHSAMSSAEAYRRCPTAVFVHGHFPKYIEASNQVHAIMEEYTDQIEFLSLDEGYMDVTGSERFFGSAQEIAKTIQRRVYETVGTTCSVGVGYNMLSAKLASEEKKPRGFFVIENQAEFLELMKDRPVGILYGVGQKTVERLSRMGIRTVGDLANAPEVGLSVLGKLGGELRDYARGIDHRMVTPNVPAKSIGKEVTFPADVTDRKLLEDTLLLLSRHVSDRLLAKNLWCSTVTVKIKFSDLQSITRAKTGEMLHHAEDLYKVAEKIFSQVELTKPVRLIGIAAGKLADSGYEQLGFSDMLTEEPQKESSLHRVVNTLRRTYGKDTLKTAKELLAERNLQETYHEKKDG